MKPRFDLEHMSPQERLELLGEVWDSLTTSHEAVVLTDVQRIELDRRLEDLERDPVRGIPWNEVLEKTRRREHRP